MKNIISKSVTLVLLSMLLLTACTTETVVVPEGYLSPKQMNKDVNFVVKNVKKYHPLFKKEVPECFVNALAKAEEDIKQPKTKEQFYYIVNSIVTPLNDGHTAIYYRDENREKINLPLKWLHDGLYLYKDSNQFKLGDEITKIGGKTTAELFDYLKSIISSENDYYVKHLGQYYIRYKHVLNHFKLINDKNEVEVEYLRDGKLSTCYLTFEKIKSSSATLNKDWISWNIDEEHNLGYIKINNSIYDDHFISEITKFFTEVANKKVKNVVYDLRLCGGGSWFGMKHAIGFLKGVHKYMEFGYITKYNHKDPYETELYKKVDKKIKFDGNTYMLISKVNFSASNISAFIWQDNKLATLIGEPTGNKPDSYTQNEFFNLPVSEFGFIVPNIYTLRPDRSKKDDVAVFPDIEVYTTVEDLKQGRDPQMEKVYELIKENGN